MLRSEMTDWGAADRWPVEDIRGQADGYQRLRPDSGRYASDGLLDDNYLVEKFANGMMKNIIFETEQGA